jgi:hypothetical protein
MGTFATRQEPAEERTGADTEIRLWPEGGRAYGYRQATAGTSTGATGFARCWDGAGALRTALRGGHAVPVQTFGTVRYQRPELT